MSSTAVVIVTTLISTIFLALIDRFWGFLTNMVYGRKLRLAMAKKWYVIQTYSGYENKVRESLQQRIKEHNWRTASARS